MYQLLRFSRYSLVIGVLTGLVSAEECRALIKFNSKSLPSVQNGKIHFGLPSAVIEANSWVKQKKFKTLIKYNKKEQEILSNFSKEEGSQLSTFKQNLRGLVELNVGSNDCKELEKELKSWEQFPEVEYTSASRKTINTESDSKIEPVFEAPLESTPDLSHLQFYKDSLNIDYAWSQNAKGQGVKVVDIEYSWSFDHEDLQAENFLLAFGAAGAEHKSHGTKTVGILFAKDNGIGMTGMVPDIDSLFGFSQVGGRAEAFLAAIERLDVGDVIINEMQQFGLAGRYVPSDYDQVIWDITKEATDAGIVVVAMAGNGDQNLDAYGEYMARGDNGSIIVGAGSQHGRNKLEFSTYGSRVDIQGWGENVATTDFRWGGTHFYGNDMNRAYTSTYGGTSSATPVAAAAVIAVQSWVKLHQGRYLTSREMRKLLKDTGKPQGSGGNIGPLPDVQAAIEKLIEESGNSSVVFSSSNDLGSSSSFQMSMEMSSQDVTHLEQGNSQLVWRVIDGYLNIQGENIQSIQLYKSNGEAANINIENSASGSWETNVRTLSDGVYFIKAKLNVGSKIFRFTVH